MMTYLAVAGAALFTVIALIHYTWAATGRVPPAVIPTRRDGSPLFEPKRIESAVVATVLLVAALLLLQRGGVGPILVPKLLRVLGSGLVSVVMLMRGLGDFAYVGLFKRERYSLFGRMDTRYYTPLVLVLGVIAGFVSYGGQ